MLEFRARRSVRADLLWVSAALLLLAAAVAAGIWLNRPGSGVVLFADTAPVFGIWLPHLGPGTLPALLLAFAVIAYGGRLADRLRLRCLLPLSYLAGLGWTAFLALVDGWQRGIAERLTQPTEYLREVPGITDIPAMLRGFAERIPGGQADSWTTHVAGHPPGATLVFVWLDRIGLSGGGWAAICCVLIGCLAIPAVAVTLAVLGEPVRARAGTPFLVLFPGAVWLGVSADAMFTGVSACGLALLAVAAARRVYWLAVPAGLLLGFTPFLSYGLVLIGLLAIGVLVLARAPLVGLLAALAAVAVFAAFALAGFWWFDGYQWLVERYYEGIAALRPYSYWVWANLACMVLGIGPAGVAGLRRVLASWRRPEATAVLAGLALLAVLLADVSGLSKAEVERIWLPFEVWLLAGTALLRSRARRGWLLAQAGTAIVVNHLLLTTW